jgi:hypothetical protein
MKNTARRCWTLGAAALLTLPGFAAVAAERTVLTTAAIDFSTTLVCSATNVGRMPLAVRIQLLSPQSGQALYDSVTVTATLDPGFGTGNEFTLPVGFTSGYCRVSFTGPATAVRAAACSKAAQEGGCQGVSEAR